MDLKDLKRIGFTEGEMCIYDALLELGETTRTTLAKKSGISPSKIYDVANRLIEKGIVSSVMKNGVLHFSAASPARLKDFLQQKELDLAKEKEIVNGLLPSLLAKYGQTRDETTIEVFSGWQGMKTVYGDLVDSLDKNDFNYIFGASSGHASEQADIFFSQYHRKKLKKGFGTKIIFNEDVRHNKERTAVFQRHPNKMRFLHQETFTEINTYKDVVLFVMLLQKPLIIRIQSKEAADSFRKFFDTMWKQAKP